MGFSSDTLHKGSLNSLFLDRIGIWGVGSRGGRESREPGEKPSEKGQEPTNYKPKPHNDARSRN